MPEPMDALGFDDLLQRLAGFTAPGGGVTRFVYDAAWCSAHRWLREEALARGLVATVDAAGNLFFHDASVAPGDLSRPVLLVGSHLDSVRGGGRYDGAYGALAGLALAAEHRGRGGLTVVGFVTGEEEQSRFDSPMMGARTLLGLSRAGELDRVRDGEGVTWRAARDAAERAGCAAPIAPGDAPFRPCFRAAMMLEPHIEQGPVLEAGGLALGIVTHVAGYRRLRYTVTGAPRHAGTTPMDMRRDALAGAAEMVLAAETLALAAGDPARATAGDLRVSPGMTNVSPGGAEIGFEVRHAEPDRLSWLADTLAERCRAIAIRRGLALAIELVTTQPPTSLSERLAALADSLARELGLSARRMVSGAGHDTMEFARAGAESLLIFVPSRGGVSHAADEYTSPEALWAGVRFTSALIERIAPESVR
jgi:allantoate deiminase